MASGFSGLSTEQIADAIEELDDSDLDRDYVYSGSGKFYYNYCFLKQVTGACKFSTNSCIRVS